MPPSLALAYCSTSRGGCACRPITADIKFLVERLREDALLGELCEDAPSEFAAICGSKMDEILASIWGPRIGSIWGPGLHFPSCFHRFLILFR